MADAFTKVTTFFKIKDVTAETSVFKLFSHGSVALCLLGSILCAANQYFGDPIICTFKSSGLDSDFAKQHCWLHGSSWVPKEFQEDFDCRVTENSDLTGNDTSYYQWVIFFLLVQCAIFLIPRQIWRLSERGLIKEFGTTDAKSALILSDEKKFDVTIKRFVTYFCSILHHNNKYFAMFVFCEALNILFLAVNFHLTNAFLSYKWGTYGFEVLHYYRTDPHLRTYNPMCNIFPTKVSCDILYGAPTGSLNTANGFCILSQNIVNEKIFLALYFWYVFLFVVSGFYAFYRIATIALPQIRERLIRLKIRGGVDGELLGVVMRRCQAGDWFVLNQLGKNVNPYFYREFVERLGEEMKRRGGKSNSKDCLMNAVDQERGGVGEEHAMNNLGKH